MLAGTDIGNLTTHGVHVPATPSPTWGEGWVTRLLQVSMIAIPKHMEWDSMKIMNQIAQ